MCIRDRTYRDRQTDRDRDTDRQTNRQRQTDTDTDTDRQTEITESFHIHSSTSQNKYLFTSQTIIIKEDH